MQVFIWTAILILGLWALLNRRALHQLLRRRADRRRAIRMGRSLVIDCHRMGGEWKM